MDCLKKICSHSDRYTSIALNVDIGEPETVVFYEKQGFSVAVAPKARVSSFGMTFPVASRLVGLH